MSYLVFARKFRPLSFEDVLGQEPIVTTLKNSILQKRIPQNFIFSGPRGVGKTSTARILAKALNCKKGPTAEPCGECVSCKEITDGTSMDVLEIDGASNRGIDEIRNLRETVKFKPVAGQYKIYIIDEVHMLTTEAFNALLKTLEEPPPHVKFVFATTEFHKVPLTILSRCQRFTFKRITPAETVEKLQTICKKEKIKAEQSALFYIAKASDGALRDAESLLDQLVSFSEGEIKEQDVLALLGLPAESVYFSILTAMKSKDAASIFASIKKLYDEGKDLVQFAAGFYEMFRHLLLIQTAENASEYIEVSEDTLKQLKEKKNDFTRGELLLAVSILGNLQNQMKRHLASPRLLIETALLKLMHLDGLKTVEQLIQNTASAVPAPAAPYPRPAGSASAPIPAASPVSMRAPVRSAEPVATPVRETKNLSAPKPAVPAPAASTPAGLGETSFSEVEAAWPRIIEYMKSKRMSNGIFLSESSPVEISGGTVTLGFPQEFQFHKDMLEKDNSRKLIEEAFEVCLGKKLRILLVISKAEQKVTAVSESDESEPAAEDKSKLPDIISEAMNIFDGARIVRKDN